MNDTPNILFTATFDTPFISTDLAILQKHFQVTPVPASGIAALKKYFTLLRYHDITFSWFASVYSSILVWLAKRTKKKSIIILGGVDVAKIPELRYGIWNSWWKSKVVRYGIKNAGIVLAVDESLRQNAQQLAQYDGGNIQVLPTGFDPAFWKPEGRKHNAVLTVANCRTMLRIKIKGIDFLLNIARALPAVHFIIVGITPHISHQLSVPSNVSIHGPLPQTELLAHYQQAKIYFQPSLREGLPNTLCEAMLCECHPIGTAVGGIPHAIGDTGTIVRYGDGESAAQAIASAMRMENNAGARERIATHFALQQREEKLVKLVTALFHE